MEWRILLALLAVFHQVHTDDQKSSIVDIYPGHGWDMLQYLEMPPIFEVANFNASMLRQSCIEVVPIRQNKISLDSEVIDLFNSQSHDYSSTIMVGGKGGYMGFGIGGSYSSEYQSIKKIQAGERTITLRNQIDYLMFDVVLRPSCPLQAEVKNYILEISDYLESDQPMMATYAAQLFVKNYGTHVTNRIHLGGSIIEEDSILQTTFQSSEETRRSYRAAAEASFLSTFSVSAKFSSSSTTIDTATQALTKTFTRKVVRSKGGSVSIVTDSMNTWQSSVEEKPAIVRRGVENITSFIQSDKIPELSESNLARVRQTIGEAVDTYFQMNTYPGCMNRSSSAFNWIANIADDSCPLADMNSQFGGFIRTCTENNRLTQKCGDYNMNNMFTQTSECPFSFQKYLIHEMTQTENIMRKSCRRCGFAGWYRCCDDVVDGTGQREIKLYICNNKRNVRQSVSGILSVPNRFVYGGSFTTMRMNPVTGTQKCPSTQFNIVRLTADISVCLAEQVLDTFNLPHYGGMFSCSQGNAVLISGEKNCPYGYTAYVIGTIDGQCILYVCLEFEKYPDVLELPALISPPFFDIPVRNQTRPVVSRPDQNDSISAISSSSISFKPMQTLIMGCFIICLLSF